MEVRKVDTFEVSYDYTCGSYNPLGLRLIGPIAGVATFIGFLIFVRGYKLADEIPNGTRTKIP